MTKKPKLPQTGGQYQRDTSGNPVKAGAEKAPAKPARPAKPQAKEE
jgi:hypothetical protein